MDVTRFILVRHGETLANRDFRYIGARDDVLSETGCQQAEQLADALSILPVSAVYSSPLLRARHTAHPIALKHGLQEQIADELREASFGDWEGMSRAEVIARSPQDEQLLHQWENDPYQSPPSGESFIALQKRVHAFIENLSLAHPGQTVVLVAHVGPIKVLLCDVLHVPLTALFHMFLDPATISVIDWGSKRSILRLFNSHTQSGWSQARWMQH